MQKDIKHNFPQSRTRAGLRWLFRGGVGLLLLTFAGSWLAQARREARPCDDVGIATVLLELRTYHLPTRLQPSLFNDDEEAYRTQFYYPPQGVARNRYCRRSNEDVPAVRGFMLDGPALRALAIESPAELGALGAVYRISFGEKGLAAPFERGGEPLLFQSVVKADCSGGRWVGGGTSCTITALGQGTPYIRFDVSLEESPKQTWPTVFKAVELLDERLRAGQIPRSGLRCNVSDEPCR